MEKRVPSLRGGRRRIRGCKEDWSWVSAALATAERETLGPRGERSGLSRTDA